jgi:hypothetical protein
VINLYSTRLSKETRGMRDRQTVTSGFATLYWALKGGGCNVLHSTGLLKVGEPHSVVMRYPSNYPKRDTPVNILSLSNLIDLLLFFERHCIGHSSPQTRRNQKDAWVKQQ